MSVSGVSHANVPRAYYLNDFLDGDPMYIGKAADGNVWVVQKFSTASGVMLYANNTNNPTVLTYAAAWSAKDTLNYAQYQALGY